MAMTTDQKREAWKDMQDQPDMLEFVNAVKEAFGQIELVKYDQNSTRGV